MTERPCPPTVPAVPIALDRERWFVEDFAALAAFEEATGLNAKDAEVMSDLNTTNYSWYLWALLRRESPDVSIEQMREWLSEPRYLVEAERAVFELQNEAVRLAREALDDRDAGGDGDPLSGGGGGVSSPTPTPSG